MAVIALIFICLDELGYAQVHQVSAPNYQMCPILTKPKQLWLCSAVRNGYAMPHLCFDQSELFPELLFGNTALTLLGGRILSIGCLLVEKHVHVWRPAR